jgi:3-methyladenine DNA glycosylase Tag
MGQAKETGKPRTAASPLSKMKADANRSLFDRQDFSSFVWNMVAHKPVQNSGPIPTKTALSEEMSAALKKRGFKFVGPVIVYAWMQAVGIVNDHSADCFRRSLVGQ